MTEVLLAEDDAAIAEPLARALTREGYGCVVVADGPAALEQAIDPRFSTSACPRWMGSRCAGSYASAAPTCLS